MRSFNSVDLLPVGFLFWGRLLCTRGDLYNSVSFIQWGFVDYGRQILGWAFRLNFAVFIENLGLSFLGNLPFSSCCHYVQYGHSILRVCS
jgi:hypothetical protein